MPTVAEYQSKFDEISKIRQAAKRDFFMSNDEKRKIAREYTAIRHELQAASKAAMAAATQTPTTTTHPTASTQAPATTTEPTAATQTPTTSTKAL
jgi:hypothetical protein